REARESLAAVLADADDSPAAARALHAAGNFAGYYEGDHERARQLLTRGLAVARAVGASEYVGGILVSLGMTVRAQGDHESARSHYEAALEIQQDAGDAESVAVTLANLGITILESGDVAGA